MSLNGLFDTFIDNRCKPRWDLFLTLLSFVQLCFEIIRMDSLKLLMMKD